MSILNEIVEHKRREIEERKELHPIKLLEKSIHYSVPCVSLKRYLGRTDLTGIIAEFKRKSPSQGFINQYAEIEETTLGYMQAGASALSVLTDSKYFGGSNEDLLKARRRNFCPILRKDFVVDEYQVIEAKAIGADAVLLIAEVLTDDQICVLTKLSESLGLEVLLEAHSEEEVRRATNLPPTLVGINNRNLSNFSVDVSVSLQLADLISKDKVKVAESGIKEAVTVIQLKHGGFQGFLIGEAFMRSSKPSEECARFINEIKRIEGSHR